MEYFKIIINNEILGVITSDDFREWQAKHGRTLISTPERGQFVEYDDKFYRDNWMRAVPSECGAKLISAKIEGISEDEYLALVNRTDTVLEYNAVELPEQPQMESGLDGAKTVKILEARRACGLAITDGFDITLQDGTHHFSMSIQDQMNMLNLASLASAGQTQIPYHADGEECRYFTASEIQMITAKAMAHKLYQEAYFNSLKSYIRSLGTVEAVSAIEYGCEIPNEFKSDVLKQVEVL